MTDNLFALFVYSVEVISNFLHYLLRFYELFANFAACA